MRHGTLRRAFAVAIFAGSVMAACSVEHRSAASAVTGAGLGAFSGAAKSFVIQSAATFMAFWTNGQSLSAGDNGDPPLSTTPWGNSKQLIDLFGGSNADGGYQIADASCSTCALLPAKNGIRMYPGANALPLSCQTNGPYPCEEWGGENPVGRISFQIDTWTRAKGVRYDMIIGDVGQPSQPLSGIQQGTRTYNAMMWELGVADGIVDAGIDGGPHGTVVVPVHFMVHGQADATNTAYGSGLTTYASNVVTDTLARTGQNRIVATCPLCVPVIAATPTNGEAPGVVSIDQEQMLVLTQTASAGVFAAVCPDYNMPFVGTLTQIHHSPLGYAELGECLAKFYWREEIWQQGQGPWIQPFAPKKINALGASPADPATFTFSGNDVTIAMTGAVGAVVVDLSVYRPHPVGSTYGAYWSTGGGFELYSGGKQGTPVAITSVSCSGSGSSATCTVHGGGAWDTIAYAFVQDGTQLLDGGFYDSGAGFNGGGGPPNGVGGNIRDSDCASDIGATISGVCPYNWLFTSWYQTR